MRSKREAPLTGSGDTTAPSLPLVVGEAHSFPNHAGAKSLTFPPAGVCCLVALVLVGRWPFARRPARGVRSGGYPMRTCTGTRTLAAARRAGAPPRKRRRRRPSAPGDQLSPINRRSLLGPSPCLLPVLVALLAPSCDSSHFSHVCNVVAAGVSPPLKP